MIIDTAGTYLFESFNIFQIGQNIGMSEVWAFDSTKGISK